MTRKTTVAAGLAAAVLCCAFPLPAHATGAGIEYLIGGALLMGFLVLALVGWLGYYIVLWLAPAEKKARVRANRIEVSLLVLLALGAGTYAFFQARDVVRDSAEISALVTRAEGGEAAAQMTLGDMYTYGRRVPVDYKGAARWYRMAAEQGDVRAQHRTGLVYREGIGVEKDAQQALLWLEKAAAREGPSLDLAEMHEKGEGVPADALKAMEMYATHFSDRNTFRRPLAMFRTGRIYANGGKGVERDRAQAFLLYNLALKAAYRNTEFEEALKKLAAEMTEEEKAKGMALFMAATEDARTPPEAEALYNRALNFLYGDYSGREIVAPDKAEAARLFRQAADLGHPEAQNTLGMMYQNGEGVTQDYAAAYFWCMLSERRYRAAESDGYASRSRDNAMRAQQMGKISAEEAAEIAQKVAEWKPSPPEGAAQEP